MRTNAKTIAIALILQVLLAVVLKLVFNTIALDAFREDITEAHRMLLWKHIVFLLVNVFIVAFTFLHLKKRAIPKHVLLAISIEIAACLVINKWVLN